MLATCLAPAAAPGSDGGGADRPAGGEINLVWDTFRGPGTGWNEERIDTFKAIEPNASGIDRPLTSSSQPGQLWQNVRHARRQLGNIIAFDPSTTISESTINADIIGPIQRFGRCRQPGPKPSGSSSLWCSNTIRTNSMVCQAGAGPARTHWSSIKSTLTEAGIEPPDPDRP
ncbi:MAG: hypothetical protein R2911_00595 [Caldilineaceae bacterium]